MSWKRFDPPILERLLAMVLLAVFFALTGSGSGVKVVSAATPVGAQRFVIAPGESTVTYRVNETLFNEGNRLNTAVGTTTVVRGEIFVDRARPANSRIGTITVDISQFKSDSERRDNAIRRQWLESAKYPIAEFAATEIKGLPETYQEGREVPVEVTGNLKIRDVTRRTTMAAAIKLDGNRLTIIGSTSFKMTDFGFDPPAIVFLRTENEVRLEFRLVAVS